MRSQVRGPYCAREIVNSPALPPTVQVAILEGGYSAWRRAFAGSEDSEKLFEGLLVGLEEEEEEGGQRAKVDGVRRGRDEWVDEEDQIEEMHSVELRQKQKQEERAQVG